MLPTRFSRLLCERKEFSNAIPEYEDAMHRSGHAGKLEYADNLGPRKKRGKETSRGLTLRLARMSKPTSARNSCDCLLNNFLPITDYTRSATNSMSK